ncbi:hypothetical protein HOY80DRAFT_1060832 [Tuber brumale]|nr:hypothetical protein HOY80DRAFT_1060832 [Tuber brumale]
MRGRTSSGHPEFIKQGRDLILDLTAQMEITDGFLHGPQIVPLAPQNEFDAGVISAYISQVLRGIKRDNAHGVFAAVVTNSGPPIPTLIFGIPPPTLTPAVLPPAPGGLPALVRTDFILLTNGFQTLGHGAGSLVTAGNFGGFLRRPSNADAVFGITAGHCARRGSRNSTVLTFYFGGHEPLNRLVSYTSLCPPMAGHWHVSGDKEREAKWLLAQFRFQEGPSGVEFLDPEDGFRLKKGVLLGRRVGHIVDYGFGQRQNLLYAVFPTGQFFNAKGPASRRLPGLVGFCRLLEFGLHRPRLFFGGPALARPTAYKVAGTRTASFPGRSRMGAADRLVHIRVYGGNTYDGELAPETGDLYPDVEVEKIARSTGAKHGRVNGYYLQHLTGGQESYEVVIASTGRGMVFAAVGDSGGCVFAKENGVSKAAGILIGKITSTIYFWPLG